MIEFHSDMCAAVFRYYIFLNASHQLLFLHASP